MSDSDLRLWRKKRMHVQSALRGMSVSRHRPALVRISHVRVEIGR